MMTIRVNEVEIPEAAVAREVQFHPAASLAEARREAAQALVVRELLLQEAHRLALVPSPDGAGEVQEDIEDALIRCLLEQEVTVPEPDEAECREHYLEHAGVYRSPDLYEAAHILFPARADDQTARDEAGRAAAAILALVRAEPRRFAELAREHSACPSRAEGGGLGQFTPDQMVPEFIAGLDGLEPGALAPAPIASRYGFHVVRLDQRLAGRPLPFERVQERIQVELYDWRWRQAVHGFIAGLVSQARIVGVEMRAA
ncbi:MAG: peptidylprolyl isomerase [Rhodospirillaceae bacterium]